MKEAALGWTRRIERRVRVALIAAGGGLLAFNLARSLCMDAASRLAGRSESGLGHRAQDDSRIVRTLFPVETAMENCLCRNPLRLNFYNRSRGGTRPDAVRH